MANRRMFSREVCKSDVFLDMPVSARELYFQLGLDADDDGFVSSPRSIQRSVGATNDDMITLKAKGYIIPFSSGVIVITHWKQNNYLRNDRYRETIHTEEKSMITETPNGVYRLIDSSGIPEVYQVDTQYRLGKDRLGKERNILSGKPDRVPSKTIESIISILNAETGSNYATTTKKTRTLINARFSEGFTEVDFKDVISYKTNEWKGGDMDRYLRPETLFGTKFEGYLQEARKCDRRSNGYSEYR